MERVEAHGPNEEQLREILLFLRAPPRALNFFVCCFMRWEANATSNFYKQLRIRSPKDPIGILCSFLGRSILSLAD